jgi:hypothetical protein
VDEMEVAFDSCGEVSVVGSSDGEGRGEKRGLGVGHEKVSGYIIYLFLYRTSSIF